MLRKSDKVKDNLVVAQSTTTKRSAITIEQQYRWHKTINYAYGELRQRNTEVCRKSGKTFGEMIKHFIIGGDESCFMASVNGDCRVIGSVGKAKHERNIMDSRSSIIAYRTGTVGGSTGPTIILLKGNKIRRG